MKKLSKPRIVLLLAVLLGLPLLAGVSAERISAHEGEEHQSAQAQPEKEEEKKDSALSADQLGKYSYVAQPGDSYTLLARKAIQTYGKRFNAKLSLADIIFVETNLTQAAGSPQLVVGQQVEIDEATVRDWAERAGDLSAEAEAGWDYYVQFVDSFNTDGVGQAS
jgi:hypothetical protein